MKKDNLDGLPMGAWVWDQSAGILTCDGVEFGRGYSGNKEGKNNPLLQGVKGVGPIPRGDWMITEMYDSANVGPYALKLEPCEGTKTMGRSAFRIHGDSIKLPGEASHGCIILPRPVRLKIWQSGNRHLRVVE